MENHLSQSAIHDSLTPEKLYYAKIDLFLLAQVTGWVIILGVTYLP